MGKLNTYIEDFDWDDVHPIKAISLSVASLFIGFGFMKLSLLASWWLIIPTWIVCIIVMAVTVIATFDKLFGD